MTSHPGESDTVSWGSLLAETRRRVGDDATARWICETASGAETLAEVLGEPATVRGVAHLDSMVARHLAGEPLAYVLGRWGFRRLDLAVDRRVLIPRPETELVAEVAIELATAVRAERGSVVVADLGTGSGAIGLALADELPLTGVEVWLTDVDPGALDVARSNLAGIGRAGANVRLADPGSWFAPLPDGLVVDVVVSNPPYVAEGSPLLEESVLAWEPSAALFAGAEGLDAIAELAAAAPAHVRAGGWLVLEHGADQGAAVSELLVASGYVDVAIRPDLAGRDRIAVARLPS